MTTEDNPLRQLAGRVLRLVPLATGVRSLSSFESKIISRNRMHLTTSKMVSEIQSHLLGEAQAVACSQRQPNSTIAVIDGDGDHDIPNECEAFGCDFDRQTSQRLVSALCQYCFCIV